MHTNLHTYIYKHAHTHTHIYTQRIYAWKKKVVLVLNKIDTLSQHDRLDDLHKIEAFVRENGRQVLNEDPVVFGVSSLSAFQAKQGYAQAEEEGDEEKKEEYQRMLHDSGFPALQQYLLETIAGGNRMRLKFESPIGVAEQLLFKYSQALEDRRRVIQDDASVLELFDSDMATFKTDMIADFEYQQNKLENVFLKMKRNADEFFQENLTLSQLPQLILHRHRLKEAFDQKVNEDVNEDVQECVNTLIDWLINRSNRQFASAVRHISRTSIARRNQSQHRSYESGRGHRDNGDSDGDGDGDHDQFDALLAGSRAYSNASSNVNDHSDHSNASGSRHSRKLDLRHSLATDSIDLNVNFYTRRSSLLEGFDSHTKSLLTATDRQKQCNDIDEKIRSAVLQLSAIEMTSLGLGALFSTALFDWTGIAGALSLSVGGLYLLPYKRQQLQADMRVTIDTMQHRMLKLTRRHFEKELESNIRMIHDRLDPYSKFVRMESERVQELDTRLKTSVKKLSQLRRKIREITTQAKSGEKGD